MILPLWVGAAALLLLGATDRDVSEGLEQYERLKYDRAVVALQRALAKPELSRSDRVQALETLGLAYTVLEDAPSAEAAFQQLLDLDPAHGVDAGLSPRLVGSFDRARKRWREGRAAHAEIVSSADDRTLRVRITAGDPRRLGAVSAREEGGREQPLLCKGNECRGQRPERAFTLELCDHTGAVLERTGPFAPATQEETRWWLYVGAGLVVVGAGIALTVALLPDEPPAGSLGRLQLP